MQEIAYLLHTSAGTVGKYLAIPENEIPEDKHIVRERQYQETIRKKEDEMNLVRKMYEEGMCIEEISRITHHVVRTVKNYLDPNSSPVNRHYDQKRRGKLTVYEKDILNMRSEGMTYEDISGLLKQRAIYHMPMS